jgi:hypothetical protein
MYIYADICFAFYTFFSSLWLWLRAIHDGYHYHPWRSLMTMGLAHGGLEFDEQRKKAPQSRLGVSWASVTETSWHFLTPSIG